MTEMRYRFGQKNFENTINRIYTAKSMENTQLHPYTHTPIHPLTLTHTQTFTQRQNGD